LAKFLQHYLQHRYVCIGNASNIILFHESADFVLTTRFCSCFIIHAPCWQFYKYRKIFNTKLSTEGC